MAVVPEQGHGAGDGAGGEDFPALESERPGGGDGFPAALLTVKSPVPLIQIRSDDWAEMQALVTAARDLVRAVRSSGSCPGAFTARMEELSRRCGLGPMHEWLAGIAKAVGFGRDDNKPHVVMAAVADMVEDLGSPVLLHDVVAALALVLDCAILEPEDVEALLDAGLGLWTERVS